MIRLARSPRASCGALILLWSPFITNCAWAQVLVLPSGVQEQLDEVIGRRVETTAVLGTQSAASGGGYGWKANDADGEIFRVPWKFELHDPRPLGDTGMSWTPVFQGGFGYGRFVNHFNDKVLVGNESRYTTTALAVGTGPRLYFGDGFSVLPALDFLHAYTVNSFRAQNPLGELVSQLADGTFINWRAHTMTFVPSFELRYRKTFGDWTPEFTSTFAYFNTIPISRSTDALSFTSHSMLWANRIDLDYRTPIRLFDRPLHVSGDFTWVELYDGLREALASDYFLRAAGQVKLDVLGKLWKAETVGLGGGYFWSNNFNGFSVGLEASLKL